MASGEPSGERLDRNWQELLQELRVAQTGVQILTGFLLTIPFTPRFETLPESRQTVYCVILVSAAAATILLMTPVAMHRALFRQGARQWLVVVADRLARWGLGLQFIAICGVVWLILDLIGPLWIACTVASLLAVLVLVLWVLIPLRERWFNGS